MSALLLLEVLILTLVYAVHVLTLTNQTDSHQTCYHLELFLCVCMWLSISEYENQICDI